MQTRIGEIMQELITNDRALVKDMLSGKEAALNAFYETYFPRLYRFALRRVNGDAFQAEDLVQDTLVQGIRRIETWRGEAPLFSWLCTICRRAIGEDMAKKARFGVPVELNDDLPEIRAALESLAASEMDMTEYETQRSQIVQLVQSALDYLPPHYGDCLEWKYIQGFSVNEISARMQISAKAVESLLSRARPAFREAFTLLAGPTMTGGKLP